MSKQKPIIDEPKDNYGSQSSSNSGGSSSGSTTRPTLRPGVVPMVNNPAVGGDLSGFNDKLDSLLSMLYSDTEGSWENVNDPILKLFYYLKYNAGGDRDAATAYANTFLQYLLGEQNYQRDFNYSELNYQRSLAPNQVSLMQSAGMSRAAALAALQGGSTPQSVTSQTAVNPNPSSIEQNALQKQQNIMDIVRLSADLVNQIVSLASVPFDIKSKLLTNQIMNSQSNMLTMQLQGMQDAAMFTQAVANADSRQTDDAKKVGKMSINDQYAYFANMSGQKFDFAKHSASSWQYAQSDSFRRASANPFFWAALNETTRNRNYASASVYEPERAQAEVAQVRAAVSLTQNQAFSEKMTSKILQSQAFIDEYTSQIRKDMEIMKAISQQKGFEFDFKRAQAFVDRVSTFNQFDFAQMNYEIERLSYINDPVVFEKQKDALTSSLDYQVANYIFGSSIASLKSGVLQSLMTTNEQGVSVPSDDLMNWTKTYLKFNELGYGSQISSATDIARTVFSGVTSASALGFVGYKVISGLNAVKNSVAGYTMSSSAPLGLQSLSPLVIPAPEILKQTLSFGSPAEFNGMQ